jgi:YggT family protein
MFIWRLLSALLVVYIILLSMRFLLSWFPGAASGPGWRILLRFTDPYLRLFRGLSFLRRGLFDFTAVAAVLVLIVALDLLEAVARYGRFTLGLLLGTLAGAVWAGLSFLLILFIVLAALRLVFRLFTRRYESPLGDLLQAMVRPLVSLARSLLPRAVNWREEHLLLVVIAALLAAQLLGGQLFRLLRASLLALPF